MPHLVACKALHYKNATLKGSNTAHVSSWIFWTAGEKKKKGEIVIRDLSIPEGPEETQDWGLFHVELANLATASFKQSGYGPAHRALGLGFCHQPSFSWQHRHNCGNLRSTARRSLPHGCKSRPSAQISTKPDVEDQGGHKQRWSPPCYLHVSKKLLQLSVSFVQLRSRCLCSVAGSRSDLSLPLLLCCVHVEMDLWKCQFSPMFSPYCARGWCRQQDSSLPRLK